MYLFCSGKFRTRLFKTCKNNRLNTIVLLSINIKFYYRPIILIQGLKWPHAGTKMKVRLIII